MRSGLGNCGVYLILCDVDLAGHPGDVRGLVILVHGPFAGRRGNVRGLIILFCGSFLGVGPGLGDHVNYSLQLFTAVFFDAVRLVLDGVG